MRNSIFEKAKQRMIVRRDSRRSALVIVRAVNVGGQMKTLLLSSTAALGLLSSAAFAADLPQRGPAPAPAPIYAAPIFTWTGFYIGANAGAAFNGGNRNIGTTGFGAPVAFYGSAITGNDSTRFTGGGQIGFNWQSGQWVWGLEADLNYLDRGNNGAIAVPVGAALPFAVVNGGNNGNNWFGTVRGRLGLAYNRSLFYVTGGFAYSGSQNNQSITYFNTTGCVAGCGFSTTTNDSNIGWAAGGGIEYAFTDNISAKIEYLHVELGRRNAVFSSAAVPAITITSRNPSRFDVVRAGLNFRFGAFSQAAPVVARY
jgi:outer membrane immunogenic protein